MNLPMSESNTTSNSEVMLLDTMSVTPVVAECAVEAPVEHERRDASFTVSRNHPVEPLHRKGEWRTTRYSNSSAIDRQRCDRFRSSSDMVPTWVYAAR